jgi:DNA anti-recombination protein RmuC
VSSSNKSLSGFIDVFEGRLHKMRDQLKEELDKSKSERSRTLIKYLLRDYKKLNKFLKEVKQEHAKKCPHCGKHI